MSVERNQRVAILLCTFNGERYLSRQIDSIVMQDHRDWVIYASDDGSTDGTRALLSSYQSRLGEGRLVVIEGPQAGYAANFMSLLRAPAVSGDYYAFCDQDDCWDADKLSRALAWMRLQPADVPALYCGRTRLMNNDEQTIGYSPLFGREPSFRNALTQSLAGGNTMLINASGHALMARTPPGVRVQSHDWWAYLLVTACGGRVHYDSKPSLGYRQHGENLIGSNAGMRDRLARLWHMLEGNYREWNDANLALLQPFDASLTPENRLVLALFKGMRGTGFFKRLSSLVRGGFYRQTLAGNVGMVVAVALRRF